MGIVMQPKCRACGFEWGPQLDGGTRAGETVRCVECGAQTSVDRASLDAVQGRRWSPLSGRRVARLLGRCTCGGLESTTAPLRCPACASTDVDARPTGVIAC